MARKIRVVTEEAVTEVHGVRRVHRAGARRCIFCESHYATGNTDSSSSTNEMVNITVTSSVVDMYTNLNNTIMRDDTTVTMLTIAVPQNTGLNLDERNENLPGSTTHRIHAITSNPIGQNNAEAAARSPGFVRREEELRYRVLLTIRCHSNMTLP